MYVCAHVRDSCYKCEGSRDNLQTLVLFFHHVESNSTSGPHACQQVPLPSGPFPWPVEQPQNFAIYFGKEIKEYDKRLVL